MSRRIELTQGMHTTVDKEDYKFLSQWSWYYNSDGYASSRCKITGKELLMHRVILNPSDDKMIDHVDRDKLNNRKANLREATNQLNQANTEAREGTSIYKGVLLRKGQKNYEVNIGFNNRMIYLGKYNTEEIAAHVYNLKALELFGEFALLNDVPHFSEEEVEKDKSTIKRKSKYAGLNWRKRSSRWEIYVTENGKQKYVGSHKDEDEAFRMRENYIKENT